MFGWCRHDWEKVDKEILPSGMQQLNERKREVDMGGVPMEFFKSKVIWLLRCTKCHKYKKLMAMLVISIVLLVIPCEARDAWQSPAYLVPGPQQDITVWSQDKGLQAFGDYDRRTGDLFIYEPKTGRMTTGTVDRWGVDIKEWKGFDRYNEDE